MTGPNGKVRDGVILCGVFTVLIASLFTPFSLVTIWFLPLPFFLYTVRHSWPSALFPAAVLGALALILLHPLWIFGVLFAAATGMAMGAFYRSTAASGTDVVLRGSGRRRRRVAFGVGGGPVRFWIAFGIPAALAGAMGPGGGDGPKFSFRRLLFLPCRPFQPYSLFFLSILIVPTVLLSAWAGRRLLVRSGFPEKRLPPFYRWRFPRSFLFFTCCRVSPLFCLDAESGAYPFSQGSFIILDMLFAVQGLSFLAFLLRPQGKGPGMAVAGGFRFVLPPAAFLLLVLGIMDVGTRMTGAAGRNGQTVEAKGRYLTLRPMPL